MYTTRPCIQISLNSHGSGTFGKSGFFWTATDQQSTSTGLHGLQMAHRGFQRQLLLWGYKLEVAFGNFYRPFWGPQGTVEIHQHHATQKKLLDTTRSVVTHSRGQDGLWNQERLENAGLKFFHWNAKINNPWRERGPQCSHIYTENLTNSRFEKAP